MDFGRTLTASKAERISPDGEWRTNDSWPDNLLQYIPTGMYFARLNYRGKLVRRKLDTTVFKEAKKRLAAKLDEFRSEIDRRLSKQGQSRRCTWDEASDVVVSDAEGRAFRKELSHLRAQKIETISRKFTFFWPSVGTRVVESIGPNEAADLFTEAAKGERRFKVRKKGKRWGLGVQKRDGFKAGKQEKGSYNGLLGFAILVADKAVEIDKTRGFGAFNNPFAHLKIIETPDPKPQLPNNAGLVSILLEIKKPVSRVSVEHAYLNYACSRFMAAYGPRIGELLGRMLSHHPDDEEHPGFTWNDIHDDESTDPYFEFFSEKKSGKKKFKPRKVPFTPGTAAFVAELREKLYKGDPNAKVFEGINLSHGVNYFLRRACSKCKHPILTQQDLRHYFVTSCVEGGIDFKTIADYVGHEDGGILLAKTYAHGRPEHASACARRIAPIRMPGEDLLQHAPSPQTERSCAEDTANSKQSKTQQESHSSQSIVVDGTEYSRHELRDIVRKHHAMSAILGQVKEVA